MEHPPKFVDRILQSLTPLLAEEFERAVQEALQRQEETFQSRLEGAVRDAELAALNSAAARHEQALAEVREEVRNQVEAEFQSQSGEGLKRTIENLTAQFDEERVGLQNEIRMWRVFAEAQRELGECDSQAEMLSCFMRATEPFAPYLAVYVMKGGRLGLWRARGEVVFAEAVSGEAMDSESYFKPVVVRARTVAAVCAPQPCSAHSLDFLVTSLARTIEAFGMKLQTSALHVSLTS
jgi:hypothetical protein